jgi:O-antigen/teichoic acid export membrane protein
MSTQDTKEQVKGGFFRETFRHTAIYSGASVLGRMISFFMLPFYAHILRDIGYGVIGMIDAALVFLSSLVGYQFQGAINRIYHEEPDVERKKLVIPTGILLVAGLTASLMILVSLLSRPTSQLLLGSSDYWHLIIIATAGFAIDMVGTSAQTILLIKRRSVLFSIISLTRLITGIGLNILLVVILRWDLLGYFVAALVTSVVSTTISLTVAIRDCGLGFDRELARRLLAFQLPLIPGTFTSFFSRQIERILVRYQIDIATLGVLEMAYKFPVIINLLVTMPFMRSWGPKQMEIADEPGAPERMGRMFTYFFFLILFGCLLMAVNVPVALELLTPPEFWPGFRVARIEIMKIIVGACYGYLAFGLLYAKRTGKIARITMVVSVIKVALAYVMISNWGIYGAAWSGFIAMSIKLIWGSIWADRYYHLPIDWRSVMLILTVAVVIFLGIDSIETETIAAWAAPVLEKSRDLLAGMQDTWLGQWKNGKVLQILIEKSDLMLELGVKTLLAAVYLILMPLVHVETRQKLLKQKWPLG